MATELHQKHTVNLSKMTKLVETT